MRTSLDTLLLSYLILFSSSFSPLSSSPSSSCALQAQFNLNRMYQPGELVLGGLFPISFSHVSPDMSFPSEPQVPTCYG